MLTREQIRKIAGEVARQHGMLMLSVLDADGRYGGSNMVAMMEIFAERIAAAESDIVATIDGKLGAGWCRELAEALHNDRS